MSNLTDKYAGHLEGRERRMAQQIERRMRLVGSSWQAIAHVLISFDRANAAQQDEIADHWVRVSGE